MSEDQRILIVTRATDEDINALVVCLKSLEINPPVIDYDICVVVPDGNDHAKEFLQGIDGLRIVDCEQSFGIAFNDILESTQQQYIVSMHPDVVFRSKSWSDQIFSTMLQNDLAMLGAQPFHQFDLKDGGKIQTVSDFFRAYMRKPLVHIGGFHGLIDVYGHSFVTHLRLQKYGYSVMGGVLDPVLVHLNCCRCDVDEVDPHTMTSLSNIYDQEQLGHRS